MGREYVAYDTVRLVLMDELWHMADFPIRFGAAMDLRATKGVASRFAEFNDHLSRAVGHANRHGLLVAYCTGLLFAGGEEERGAEGGGRRGRRLE